MGLFSDMEKFGLKNFKDAKVIDKDKPVDVDIAKLKPKAPEKNETDALFTKHYTCPVCDLKFVTRSIRAGRVKLLEKDIDLRPIYDIADPLKYDVITCDKCGYSSLSLSIPLKLFPTDSFNSFICLVEIFPKYLDKEE